MSEHDWKGQAEAEAHISESYRRERDDARAEIARLTERCDAYLGQVKVGDEQILALRDRAKEMQREKAELTERCDAYREALAGMLRWFGKYPEFVPNSERMEECIRAIENAEALLRRYMCEKHGAIDGDHCPKCSETFPGLPALKDKTP